MLCIAHRGASADAPENSLEAFELACAQGADMIETDLHLARDGSVPLLHDSELGGVPVGDLTLEEIRALAPRVVTLEETLDAFGERILFNLELKLAESGEYAGLEERVLDAVRRRGLLERTLFSCFGERVLGRLRAEEQAARLALLLMPRARLGVFPRARRLGVEAVHPHARLATRDFIRKAHAEDFRVHVFTVDAPEQQRALFERGADGIFTNYPGRLRALLSG